MSKQQRGIHFIHADAGLHRSWLILLPAHTKHHGHPSAATALAAVIAASVAVVAAVVTAAAPAVAAVLRLVLFSPDFVWCRQNDTQKLCVGASFFTCRVAADTQFWANLPTFTRVGDMSATCRRHNQLSWLVRSLQTLSV